MTVSLIFILIICGILTNLMSAIFGIGGGVLMVPTLHTLFPEIPLQMVAATSLTIVMGTALINLISFHKQQIKINMRSMLLWSVGMIIGVQAGFEASFLVADWIIITVFVVTLLILALKTFLSSPFKNIQKEGEKIKNDTWQGIAVCLFGGSVAGMTGIGGGSIMAPLVNQLPSVKPYQVSAYTNWMMVIGGLGSLYGYLSKTPSIHLANSWQVGYVSFSIVSIVVLSSFLMSFFSMKIRGVLKPKLANTLLGLILLVIALYMILLQFI